MIAAAGKDGLTALVFELPPGTAAYVDADWVVTGAEAPIPALFHEQDGLRFGDGPPRRVPDGVSADAAAATALIAVARDVAAAVGAAPSSAEVSGRGLIAHQLRALLGAGEPGRGGRRERPAAWVDTTGDPAVITAGIERVADMGTVVLAGEPAGRRMEIDLYADVHRRGLRVVGAGRPLAGANVAGQAPSADFPAPASAATGEALHPALWYRLSGGDGAR